MYVDTGFQARGEGVNEMIANAAKLVSGHPKTALPAQLYFPAV